MSTNQGAVAKRLEQGYFKKHQVNIDTGELSLYFLDKLTTAFEDSIRRFPDCYVFRFKLRVPKTFNKDTNELLNRWFYSLDKLLPSNTVRSKGESSIKQELIKEAINMVWAKDVTQNGSINYRIALFFRAPSAVTEVSLANTKEYFKKKIKTTWARALFFDEPQVQTLCLFPPANITPLNPGNKAYNFHERHCFYILSTLAKLPRHPVDDLDTVFGVKFSRNPNKKRKKK
jgi:hypothetical protein